MSVNHSANLPPNGPWAVRLALRNVIFSFEYPVAVILNCGSRSWTNVLIYTVNITCWYINNDVFDVGITQTQGNKNITLEDYSNQWLYAVAAVNACHETTYDPYCATQTYFLAAANKYLYPMRFAGRLQPIDIVLGLGSRATDKTHLCHNSLYCHCWTRMIHLNMVPGPSKS